VARWHIRQWQRYASFGSTDTLYRTRPQAQPPVLVSGIVHPLWCLANWPAKWPYVQRSECR
jgi:hypothetical protein